MKERTSKVIHIIGSMLMVGTIILIIGTISLKVLSYKPLDVFKSLPSSYKANTTKNNYNKPTKNNPVTTSKKKNNNSTNYCNLSQAEALKYIARQSFSVNGKYISFSSRYDLQREKYVANEFILNGNNSRIVGRWKMNSSTSIYLFNVKQVSGNFDPTNNRVLSGYLNLKCDGNLTGSVGRGNKQQQLNIIKNN